MTARISHLPKHLQKKPQNTCTSQHALYYWFDLCNSRSISDFLIGVITMFSCDLWG